MRIEESSITMPCLKIHATRDEVEILMFRLCRGDDAEGRLRQDLRDAVASAFCKPAVTPFKAVAEKAKELYAPPTPPTKPDVIAEVKPAFVPTPPKKIIKRECPKCGKRVRHLAAHIRNMHPEASNE